MSSPSSASEATTEYYEWSPTPTPQPSPPPPPAAGVAQRTVSQRLLRELEGLATAPDPRIQTLPRTKTKRDLLNTPAAVAKRSIKFCLKGGHPGGSGEPIEAAKTNAKGCWLSQTKGRTTKDGVDVGRLQMTPRFPRAKTRAANGRGQVRYRWSVLIRSRIKSLGLAASKAYPVPSSHQVQIQVTGSEQASTSPEQITSIPSISEQITSIAAK